MIGRACFLPKKEVAMSSVRSVADLNLKSILVATDFSNASERALRHGLNIARHFRAKLWIAHVVSSLGFILVGPDALVAAEELVRRTFQRLERSPSERGSFADLEHETLIRRGNVWEQLKSIIEEQSIDLVVVGTNGRQGLGKLFHGSASEQVFRQTAGPVLTIGPRSLQDSTIDQTRARPVVFATDFGPSSLRALRYIVPFVNERASRLILIHVFPAAPGPEAYLHSGSADEVMRLQKFARSLCKQQLERMVAQSPDLFLQPELIVEFGRPTEKILRIAETRGAETIVLGLNRVAHITAATHLPWATAYEVASRASCPVLTLRI